jgi:3-isopropylmalate/(R)-2-methylmalate dehydratase large subunit
MDIATGQTMTEKILARASGRDTVEPGDMLIAKIDLFSSIDAALFIDLFRERNLKVWDTERVVFCFDHFFQPEWNPYAAATEHGRIRAFAAEQGIPPDQVFDIGRNGISHQVPVEEGYALPGTVCVGVDTQFATVGATNTFALPLLYGAGAALLTGDIWMVVPEVVRVHLTGALPRGVLGKDVGYRLLHDLGKTVNGRVIEFSGPGVASLPMDVRMGICNCAVQIGALSMVFPADEVLLDYLKPRARRPFEPMSADPDARYAATYEYDLSTFECLIAGPFEIDLVRPLDALLGTPVTAANIGSCSSGRFEDLSLAAQVLKGHKIHPTVRMAVTPISARTMRQAEDAGLIKIFADAGAMVTTPGCGSCHKMNLSTIKLGEKERCISSSVETLVGRMGAASAEIFLGNAAVVAASAIEGRIADPAKYLQTENRSEVNP